MGIMICSLVFVLPAAAAPLQHTSSKQNRARSINHLGAIVTVLELMGGELLASVKTLAITLATN